MAKRKLDGSKLTTTSDKRVTRLRPLLPPAILTEEVAASEVVLETVARGRSEIENCLAGKDKRLVVVVGPCSIHDPDAALEYAKALAPMQQKYAKELVIVMRVYFEKPRTTVGWKGLINDPDMTGTFNINKGLRVARKLLLDINAMGLPVGTEFLDSISPQFTSDLVSWGAIGARTTESQIHRELASGLSCPIGFKNGTSGGLQVAIDAIGSASNPHSFLGVTEQGLAAIVSTTGNPATHIILRGGASGPNYDAESIQRTEALLTKSGISTGIMVDCSHDNSLKDHKNQPKVSQAVADQVAAGNKKIVGLMIESNINEGKQKLAVGTTDVSALKYGVSVTDACIDLKTTDTVLEGLANAVKAGRAD